MTVARESAQGQRLRDSVTQRPLSRPLRLGLALAAALLMGWFAVLWRDDRIGGNAADRVLNRPEMSEAEFARSLDELEQAELLNPGEEWATRRAAALILRDKEAAVRLAYVVLRREPDNFNAWVVVLNATRGSDPRRHEQALAEIRRLSPPLTSP